MPTARTSAPHTSTFECYHWRRVLVPFRVTLYSFAIFISACSILQAQAPDLSKLSDSQKEQGFGQFQASQPEPPHNSSSNEKKELEEEQARRRRAEEQLRWERERRQQAAIGIGTGAAAGGMVLGSSFQRNQLNDPNQVYDPAIMGDPNLPMLEAPQGESSYQPQLLNLPSPTRELHFGASANAVFLRDLSRFEGQIVDGINSNQLGWSGAQGIESNFTLTSSLPDDFGMHLGFLLADGDDEARSSSAQLLYTTPNIGFAPNPFRSYRATKLATVQGNMVLPTAPWGYQSVGLRWFHMGDELENQVLPNGLDHRIRTNSDSFLLQYTIAPKLEFRWIHVESLFQVGFGPMFGKSSTQLRNFVGGPPGLANEIVQDRVSGTVFFQGKLGLAIPIRKWLVTSAGVQLLAQTDMAEAAAQMSHTDFANQRYHLRTESMALGGLYAGFELRR